MLHVGIALESSLFSRLAADAPQVLSTCECTRPFGIQLCQAASHDNATCYPELAQHVADTLQFRMPHAVYVLLSLLATFCWCLTVLVLMLLPSPFFAAGRASFPGAARRQQAWL
jgi:hypothetical protein